MSKRHRFMLIKDLSWWWFNVLTFGLLPDPVTDRKQESELRKVPPGPAAIALHGGDVSYRPLRPSLSHVHFKIFTCVSMMLYVSRHVRAWRK